MADKKVPKALQGKAAKVLLYAEAVSTGETRRNALALAAQLERLVDEVCDRRAMSTDTKITNHRAAVAALSAIEAEQMRAHDTLARFRELVILYM